jgi:hypothetical protein
MIDALNCSTLWYYTAVLIVLLIALPWRRGRGKGCRFWS